MRTRDISGITPEARAALTGQHISTVYQLFSAGATRSKRAALAKAAGIDRVELTALVYAADLQRVDGLGPKWVPALGAVGVRTLRQLARQHPQRLRVRLVANHPPGGPGVPNVGYLRGWVEQASDLPPLVATG